MEEVPGSLALLVFCPVQTYLHGEHIRALKSRIDRQQVIQAVQHQARTNEQHEQQDLNQGMQTGTHSSPHPGINWGSSYRMRSKMDQALPTVEQIEARAYELYLQRDRKDGQELEDWLIAEKELKQRLY